MYPTNNNVQTPLEKLISEKERIYKQCQYQEQRLNGHFVYIHQHAGSLLLSGFSSLLFSKNTSSPTDSDAQHETNATQTVTLGLSDYLSIAKSMLPTAWDIARPILVSWGMKKVSTLFVKFLRGK